MTEKTSHKDIVNLLGKKKADVVLSDMSPDISGNYSIDHARSVFLGEQALISAEMVLKSGGNFVCKVLSGEDLQDFVEKINIQFKTVKRYSPSASRKTSSEIYIIAKYFQK